MLNGKESNCRFYELEEGTTRRILCDCEVLVNARRMTWTSSESFDSKPRISEVHSNSGESKVELVTWRRYYSGNRTTMPPRLLRIMLLFYNQLELYSRWTFWQVHVLKQNLEKKGTLVCK